jgi:hypothetical protein
VQATSASAQRSASPAPFVQFSGGPAMAVHGVGNGASAHVCIDVGGGRDHHQNIPWFWSGEISKIVEGVVFAQFDGLKPHIRGIEDNSDQHRRSLPEGIEAPGGQRTQKARIHRQRTGGHCTPQRLNEEAAGIRCKNKVSVPRRCDSHRSSVSP